MVGTLLDVWLDYRSGLFARMVRGTCPHDPLTVAVALDRVQVQSVRGFLMVAASCWSS